jgi:glutamate-1-semialdehyde 2,1-aminomutase
VTGSEAVQLAIRLARAYTKRRYFIRFENHYHGWIDNVLGGVVNPKASGKPFGMESEEDYCNTEGKDPEALEQSFILPWNDIEALEECLKKYGEEVAMIHCEPIVFNHFALLPRPGYLERMRELCTQYGIVLSFDEVITGFRVGLKGAQGRLGITPDIATFGKAIGGGAPCSMVAGKSEIMELLRGRKVLGPGTFMGYPFGLEAALTTIKILERDDGVVYREMDRIQERLTDGLKEIFKRRGIPVLIQGVTGGFFTLFGVEKEIAYTDEDVAGLDMDMVMNFWKNMQDEGVIFIVGCRWYLSVAHNDADVDRTLEAADRTMASL